MGYATRILVIYGYIILSHLNVVINILGLGLGLQDLYSATNCADNILGRFTIILQNQIARVDSLQI